ncbi:ABC transporter substrate-binding protein [Coriobacteriia bacterium Es71-Z0120]|uniref:ABC transporter substrate-binding protein n=1 Tax=Parvivirga hydrogeniphila TaxID=2939460 RepID=UPI00226091A6|nr:ABC transporter substrate-binding protein [Parvivirga hydrogeniphila]MCL4079445.1 ABC transporter substrate-binding protein [Parvivirga hydrogeniphila]
MRTKRWIRALVAAAVAALLLVAPAGCGTKQADSGGAQKQAAFPVTLEDDAGRTVTITKKPERIVSLAPANTEIVYALGALDRVVGVTTFDDYPPEVSSIAKVGDFMNPNMEAIAAAKPDLVLATGGVQADTIAKLEESGAVVLAVDPQSLDGVYAAITMVGTAIGEPAKAKEVVQGMKDDLATIQSAIEEAPVRCFIEIAQEPLYTAGSGTFINDLIEQAGGENVVTQEGYVAYSLEQLLKDDPEVYLATKGSMSDPADIEKRPGYSALSAVKAKKVFVLDDNLVSRPGPRCIEGIRQIAEALHPDAF